MVGGEHSQKFRSLALTVGETQCCEDIFTKDDNVMTFFLKINYCYLGKIVYF